jgi:hypothetical protein
VQLSQHLASQLQSGQLSQLALSLQHPALALQQPVFAAGVVVDDDIPTVPATSAPTNTTARDNLAIIENSLLVKTMRRIHQRHKESVDAVSN